MQVQYLTNEKGVKTAVQVPMRKWNDIQKSIKKLEVFNDLKEAFLEMELHLKGKLRTPTTKQLLEKL